MSTQEDMKTAVFYRHWYLDEYGDEQCTNWQSQDWWQYIESHHRNQTDMGDDNPLIHLETERKFYKYNKDRDFAPRE